VSYSVDVNVLVYASSTDHPRAAAAAEFLEHCAASHETWYLSWTTLMSYLRLVTNPAVRVPPLSSEEAHQNVDALLALPQVRPLAEPEGFWPIYREIAGSVAARGNFIPDAHLAALLKAHGLSTLYTNDADFRRFDFLDVRNPFT
jgi:toxin-antitoxin system PIN domain toxin